MLACNIVPYSITSVRHEPYLQLYNFKPEAYFAQVRMLSHRSPLRQCWQTWCRHKHTRVTVYHQFIHQVHCSKVCLIGKRFHHLHKSALLLNYTRKCLIFLLLMCNYVTKLHVTSGSILATSCQESNCEKQGVPPIETEVRQWEKKSLKRKGSWRWVFPDLKVVTIIIMDIIYIELP